ncbi:hypothetical protein DID88_003596 [Monilinia fructigena]|uniref:Uncharacterized protein n=1 Tax=Monilinia fructigena TaxID=38457 RepID=A0A395ITF9_9HELO|nr:hypothetical protein DID88_003596 [Monilinia fructigena]
MASTNGITKGLFGPELVSPEVAKSLPESYTLRALQKSDYARGFLDVLRVLTVVVTSPKKQWNETYDWYNNQGKGSYYLLVMRTRESRCDGRPDCGEEIYS